MAGSDRYQLGVPLFARAEVRLRDRPLVIVAGNHGPANPHVRRVMLNGVALDRWWVRHDEIALGGLLTFEMDGAPETGVP